MDKIGYIGNIKLKLMKDNEIIKTYTYKNNGTNYLFKKIILAITGISVKPIVKLDVRENWDQPQTTILTKLSEIEGNSPSFSETTTATTLIAVIHPQQIGAMSSSTYKMCLIDGDDNVVAYYDISQDVLNSVLEGTELYVEWTLTFGNEGDL